MRLGAGQYGKLLMKMMSFTSSTAKWLHVSLSLRICLAHCAKYSLSIQTQRKQSQVPELHRRTQKSVLETSAACRFLKVQRRHRPGTSERLTWPVCPRISKHTFIFWICIKSDLMREPAIADFNGDLRSFSYTLRTEVRSPRRICIARPSSSTGSNWYLSLLSERAIRSSDYHKHQSN